MLFLVGHDQKENLLRQLLTEAQPTMLNGTINTLFSLETLLDVFDACDLAVGEAADGPELSIRPMSFSNAATT